MNTNPIGSYQYLLNTLNSLNQANFLPQRSSMISQGQQGWNAIGGSLQNWMNLASARNAFQSQIVSSVLSLGKNNGLGGLMSSITGWWQQYPWDEWKRKNTIAAARNI